MNINRHIVSWVLTKLKLHSNMICNSPLETLKLPHKVPFEPSRTESKFINGKGHLNLRNSGEIW